jgi:UDP-glucose 4-epimerase
MQRTALITGAHGFVGRHVSRMAAANGYRSVGIGHGDWSREEWRKWGLSRWHCSDITIDSLVTYGDGCDTIFHCAGSGSVGFSMRFPYQDFQRTVGTTCTVLEYVRKYAAGTCVVLPSSAAVYGHCAELPIEISSTLTPVSPYGLNKRFAEEQCQSYGNHFGVRSSVVRLFSIFGPGLRKQLLWDACNKFTRNELVFEGTGNESRDWLHIDDAAALLVLSAERASERCSIVNGGSGNATSIRQILELLAAEFGLGEIRFTGTVRAGDPPHYKAQTREAIAWGWRPRLDLGIGIKGYVDWFRGGAL